jgi:hypothetical protein
MYHKREHYLTLNGPAHALFTWNEGRRSTFVGNSELLPSDVIDFAMLFAQRLLAGNIFIVRCHVTTNQPMRARALGGKIPVM